MPTKAEFKFDCPKCGQHILISTDWVGLGITCPSCQTRFTIPSPHSVESAAPSAIPRRQTKPTIRIELPVPAGEKQTEPNGHDRGVSGFTVAAPASVTGHEPWPELVQHLEKGSLVDPAALVTALFRELTDVRRRLELVEKQCGHQAS